MKMLQYTVKRFVIMLFTLFIIATATFFLLAATPGRCPLGPRGKAA